jgi:hypothetical protein
MVDERPARAAACALAASIAAVLKGSGMGGGGSGAGGGGILMVGDLKSELKGFSFSVVAISHFGLMPL